MSSSVRYRSHVLFCTGNKCLGNGGEDLKLEAQEYLNSLGSNQEILVTKCGCLDQCEYGPMVLVYPDGYWFSGMNSGSVRDLIDQLRSDKPLSLRNLYHKMEQKKG